MTAPRNGCRTGPHAIFRQWDGEVRRYKTLSSHLFPVINRAISIVTLSSSTQNKQIE